VITGMPEHNPPPSTERGKRRHQNRNDADKQRAESTWSKTRSSSESRFQYELRTGHRPHVKEMKNVTVGR